MGTKHTSLAYATTMASQQESRTLLPKSEQLVTNENSTKTCLPDTRNLHTYESIIENLLRKRSLKCTHARTHNCTGSVLVTSAHPTTWLRMQSRWGGPRGRHPCCHSPSIQQPHSSGTSRWSRAAPAPTSPPLSIPGPEASCHRCSICTTATRRGWLNTHMRHFSRPQCVLSTVSYM